MNGAVPGERDANVRPAEATGFSCSCATDEGSDGDSAPPSHVCAQGCQETLHELSNSVTAIVLNAQALEWKLPPYSHLKKSVREMSRSAQRSSQLMKQLMRRCARANPEERNQGAFTERDGLQRKHLPVARREH